MQDYYTLEYSPTQKCFHYDTITSMIEHNLKICADARFIETLPGYICIGVFKTREERRVATTRLRKTFGSETEKNSQETDMMTEKEYLERKIKLLEGRKKIMNAEIDFKLRMLNEALDLQKGFERSGKFGFKFEIFEED